MLIKPRPSRMTSRNILCSLMDPTIKQDVPWTTDELPTILQHQLATPLNEELDELQDVKHPKHDILSTALKTSGIKTFGDIFQHPKPPRSVLHAVKNYAKALIRDSNQILPEELVRVIYIVCILRAVKTGNRKITDLDDASIVRSARWCLTQRWLTDDMRRTIRHTLHRHFEGL